VTDARRTYISACSAHMLESETGGTEAPRRGSVVHGIVRTKRSAGRSHPAFEQDNETSESSIVGFDITPPPERVGRARRQLPERCRRAR
jgi:hypothetical protein